MIDDEAYINRVLDGDTAGFAPLMERYSRPVFALLVGMTGNRADAEELAQDAFLKAFRSLRSFRRDCSFATWIYRIAYNTALSALRKKRPDRPASMDDDTAIERLPDPIDDEAEETEANEERFRRLDRALAQLRADDRALVHMFYKQEKTVDELAAMGFTVTITGGVSPADLPAFAGREVGIVIAGRAIVTAENPAGSAAGLRATLEEVWP